MSDAKPILAALGSPDPHLERPRVTGFRHPPLLNAVAAKAGGDIDAVRARNHVAKKRRQMSMRLPLEAQNPGDVRQRHHRVRGSATLAPPPTVRYACSDQQDWGSRGVPDYRIRVEVTGLSLSDVI